MSKFYDSDDPDRVARGFAGRFMIWVIVFVLFFGLLSIALWGFGVFSSPVKGKGEAFKEQQSSTNRIAKQEIFEELFADYESTVAKIRPAKQALAQDPTSQVKQTNLTGVQNYCLDLVAQYNAESNKYLAADFKRVDLPYELNRSRCTR